MISVFVVCSSDVSMHEDTSTADELGDNSRRWAREMLRFW